jgi:hypothetical protein
MNASGCSSWPTATAMDAERRNYLPSHHQGLPLTEAAILWGTPRASDGEKGGPNMAFGAGGTPLPAQAAMWQTPVEDDHVNRERGKFNSRGEPKLSGQAAMWATPRVQSANGTGGNQQGSPDLQTMVDAWPTPAAQNWKGSSPDSVTRADGKSRMDILHYRAKQGFTPPALPTLPHGAKPSSRKGGSTSFRLLRWMMRFYGPTITRRLWASRDKRRLNPLFVEWLMGWPTGHALCGCSETEFSRWSQAMRGALSQLPMASGPWILIEAAAKPQPVQRSLFE